MFINVQYSVSLAIDYCQWLNEYGKKNNVDWDFYGPFTHHNQKFGKVEIEDNALAVSFKLRFFDNLYTPEVV